MTQEICSHTPVQPEAVTATLFAIVAAALGPNALLKGKAPILNVLIAHDSPRRLAWFDAVMAPLINFGLGLQARFGARGIHGIQADVSARQRDLAAARKTLNPDPGLLRSASLDIAQARCSGEPLIVVGRIGAKDLIHAVTHAFDSGVTAVTIGSDLGDAFLRLRPAERVAVAELLNQAWQRQPLTLSTRAHQGTIVLVLQTRRSLREMLGSKGFNSGLLPPPILCFEHGHEAGKVFPTLGCEKRWAGTIQALLNQRCTNGRAEFQVSDGAAKAFAEYFRQSAANIAHVPPLVRPYMEWIGELAPSIALVTWILGNHEQVEINAETALGAVAITRWIAMAHFAHVSRALTDGTDTADTTAKMMTKIRLKAPLSRRDLWRSFDRPRASWFEPALQALLDEKKVAYDCQQLLVPVHEPVGGSDGSDQ